MKFATHLERQKLRQIVYIASFYTLFLLFSCKNGPDIFKPYGNNATVTRILPGFHTITVGQKFDLFITQDTNKPLQITISYSENLLDGIAATVKDGNLTIKDNNKENWVRKLDVQPTCTLNIRKIDHLTINGAAQVMCIDTIKVGQDDWIEVQMNSVEHQEIRMKGGVLTGACNNTGNIYFEGVVNIFTFSCENGSWFDARNLSTSDAYVYHYTDRDIYISPKNIFGANVYGNGNIFYKTTPLFSFKKLETGKGRVLQY